MYGYIYKITNKITGKIYIGRTTKPIDKRFSEHCKAAFSEKISKRLKIQNSIRKYGAENFTLELLYTCETAEEYAQKERFYIAFYDARNPDIGYNIHEGGNGGITYIGSKPVSQKLLDALAYGRSLPASILLRLTLRTLRLGKNVSRETRDKLRQARLTQAEPAANRVWIMKDNIYKRVLPEDLSYFLDSGWVKRGPSQVRSDESRARYRKASSGRIHVHKGDENKNIPRELYDEYKALGWQDGYKKRNKN